MKPIRRHREFEKNFRSRIAPNEKLVKKFRAHLWLFMKGIRDYPLNDHALIGTRKDLRAFSVGGDIRVIYREQPDYYEFLDIGSHNQVY
ncbi:MAG: type II toxin-antitoxin system YafQ family toxin [Patescibacteria group bacterium]|nr:type II toxin-antitoxin system YafQ family toxin [Patescibacteria group bacterium]